MTARGRRRLAVPPRGDRAASPRRARVRRPNPGRRRPRHGRRSRQPERDARRRADPHPVELPRDDGPHDRLTEWWYYTGHLARRATDVRFGFEFVVFRAERGDFPVTWASHLALTDETGDAFHYAQRTEIGPAVDRSPRGVTASRGLRPVADRPRSGATGDAGAAPWSMPGAGGTDRLAAMAAAEASPSGAPGAIGLDLALAADKPPALHDTDGWIDFGPAGGSYYYSRTSMPATGTITLEGAALAVIGDAWFDHQWGDFIASAAAAGTGSR